MQYDRLITGVAAVFAVLTGVLTVVGVLVNPAVLFLALMFGASTYFMYYHASGKLAAGVYERVERRAADGGRRNGARRGGFGAEPREEWTGPREGRSVRDVAQEARRRARNGGRRQRRQRQQQAGRQRQRARRARQTDGPSVAEAYKRLDLEQGADESAVKAAYREKVKEVHPDTDSGTEREFKQVKAAYERLTDD
ncbi:J domain-containing protein [Halomicroarcula sp. GCM10025709]|uniref:J domain-containing protein n=1 Tax=Haloarcula TaxID=2237 RepID=UPI0024C431B9|nr:J domain-containing protein [Halomicroarcula sp. YJ-61-S]